MKKYISIAILICFLIFFSSCLGKWNIQVKFICSPRGQVKSIAKMTPQDKNSERNINELKRYIIREMPKASIEEKSSGKSKYLIVKGMFPNKKYKLLKKKNNRWVFSIDQDAINKKFKVTGLTVLMPGWITKSNSSKHYLNYAIWEGDKFPQKFYVESSLIPFYLTMWVSVVVIIIILIVSLNLYRKEKIKDKVS